MGEPSNLSTSYPTAFQDAIVEVAIKARDLGFTLILFGSGCKRIEQVCNGRSKPRLQEQPMTTDLHFLT